MEYNILRFLNSGIKILYYFVKSMAQSILGKYIRLNADIGSVRLTKIHVQNE